MNTVKNYLESKVSAKNYIFFIPVSIILTIIPLIVHSSNIRLDEDSTKLYGYSLKSDLFSQWKASFLLYASILLLLIGIIYFKEIFHRKDKIVIFILVGIAIFYLGALLSAIYSQHHLYAFRGAFDRAEGIVTVTCYIVLFVYSIYTFKSTNNYKYIVIPLLILVVIESFIGIFQYIGQDLSNSKLGLLLITGKTQGKLLISNPIGKLYGTLYHYDYVGSFVAIVLPLLVILTIFEKRRSYKIVLGIGSLLALWLMLGSTSRAGMVGVAVSFILAVILLVKPLLKHWKSIIIGLGTILVFIIGLNVVTKGAVLGRVPSLLSDSASMFKDTSDNDNLSSLPIKDIKNVDGHSEVMLTSETIKISYENSNYVFRNYKNEVINYSENNKVLTTTNPTFKHISFTYTKTSGRKAGFIVLALNGQNMFKFSLGNDNTVNLIDPATNQDIDLPHPEVSKFLVGKEKLGSSRGYIWSRSIPLLKNNIILGSGPDTFPFQFPQEDYIGKYYAYDNPNMIVDKPHDLYLQIALDYGLISLIAFLCIIFIYIVDCIRLYALKSHYEHSQILGIANLLGVIGYLFAGLFNDSLVSVAPIFWIVLGVGIAINSFNRCHN